MESTPEDRLRVVNEWLGWGDPHGGLWFIGVEEGTTFTEQIVSSRRGRFQFVEDERNRNSPVALRTANVVCRLTGNGSTRQYRNSRMGHRGSGVFNGNLFPLGKPSLADWPKEYGNLFGLTRSGYQARHGLLAARRHQLFRGLRRRSRPQAIICFGKAYWQEFEDLFVSNPSQAVHVDKHEMRVYKSDRVVLTPHFSRGSLMPNTALDHLVEILKRWSVTLPR